MVVVLKRATCEVCDASVCIKFQLGQLERYPVNYECPKCLTKIYGEIINNNDSLDFMLNNVVVDKEYENSQYILVLSGEFPSIKFISFTRESFIETSFSPFIRYAPHDKLEEYERLQKMLPDIINNEWKIIERIANLYFNNRHEYIEKEFNKLRQSTNINHSDYEKDISVHRLITTIFRSFDMYYPLSNVSTSKILEEIETMKETNLNGLIDLFNTYTDEDLMTILKQMFIIFNSFIKHYRNLVPVIYLEALKVDINQIKKTEGITTVTLEMLDRFYQNTYETLLENSHIVMLLDNLLNRENINDFDNQNINTLKKFKKTDKGIKLQILSQKSNRISQIFDKALNSKLRNSIGHNNYKYEPNSQIITFYNRSNSPSEEIYLIEFADYCYQTIKITLYIWDLVFGLKEMRKNI